jgi:hypothetical protein
MAVATAATAGAMAAGTAAMAEQATAAATTEPARWLTRREGAMGAVRRVGRTASQ